MRFLLTVSKPQPQHILKHAGTMWVDSLSNMHSTFNCQEWEFALHMLCHCLGSFFRKGGEG